jgi:hypothetical protein
MESGKKDPEQWAWQYVSEVDQYAPAMSTTLYRFYTNG